MVMFFGNIFSDKPVYVLIAVNSINKNGDRVTLSWMANPAGEYFGDRS